MKEKFFELIGKTLSSRKAVGTIAAVIVNFLVALSLRYGIEIDEATRNSVLEIVGDATNLVIAYVLAQGGIDAVAQFQKMKDTGTNDGTNSGNR